MLGDMLGDTLGDMLGEMLGDMLGDDVINIKVNIKIRPYSGKLKSHFFYLFLVRHQKVRCFGWFPITPLFTTSVMGNHPRRRTFHIVPLDSSVG